MRDVRLDLPWAEEFLREEGCEASGRDHPPRPVSTLLPERDSSARKSRVKAEAVHSNCIVEGFSGDREENWTNRNRVYVCLCMNSGPRTGRKLSPPRVHHGVHKGTRDFPSVVNHPRVQGRRIVSYFKRSLSSITQSRSESASSLHPSSNKQKSLVHRRRRQGGKWSLKRKTRRGIRVTCDESDYTSTDGGKNDAEPYLREFVQLNPFSVRACVRCVYLVLGIGSPRASRRKRNTVTATRATLEASALRRSLNNLELRTT